MLKEISIYIVIFLLFSAGILFGKENEKILVYYFKDISSDDNYTELSYRIPFFLYNQLKESSDKNKYILIDEEGLSLYREDKEADLWNEKVLINIGKKRQIDEIIYGAFYVQEGKPILIGKILYTNSGVVLNLTEENSKYFQAFKYVESMPVEELLVFKSEEKIRGYNPRLVRMVESKSAIRQTMLHTGLGTLYPLGDWADLYPPGIISEISVVHYPKVNVLPVGIGFDSNYVLLKRRSESGIIDSEVMIITAGVSLQYLFHIKWKIDGISLFFNAGMSMSNLFINNESWSSIDPYVKGGVNIFAKPFGLGPLVFKLGVFSIDYKQMPMDTIYSEIGFVAF